MPVSPPVWIPFPQPVPTLASWLRLGGGKASAPLRLGCGLTLANMLRLPAYGTRERRMRGILESAFFKRDLLTTTGRGASLRSIWTTRQGLTRNHNWGNKDKGLLSVLGNWLLSASTPTDYFYEKGGTTTNRGRQLRSTLVRRDTLTRCHRWADKDSTEKIIMEDWFFGRTWSAGGSTPPELATAGNFVQNGVGNS